MKNIRANLISSLTASFPVTVGGTLLGLAVTVLSAWLCGLDAHALIRADLMQMKANSAMCYCLLAPALMLLGQRKRTQVHVRIALALAAAVLVIVLVSGAEYLFDWNAGIDRILSSDLHAVGAPGRIPALTTVTLALASTAIACATSRAQRLQIASQALAVTFGACGIATLLGYLFGAPRVLFGAHEPMAIGAACATLLLALGILALHPHVGLAAPMCSDTVAARMGRRLLLSAALVLPGFAWIRLRGQAMHLYGTEFGTALVVTCSLLMMSALIVLHTARTNRAETRIRHLNRMYSVLSEVNSLVTQVSDRDALLQEASRIAVERGGFPSAWFGMVDESGRTVVPVAGLDPALASSPRLLARLSLIPADGLPGPVARAVGCARPVVSNDVSQEPADFCHLAMLEQGVRSYAVLPLIVEGKVIGIFKLQAEVTNFFHADELRLLGELVGDIVFAIRHLEQRRQLDHLAYFDALTGLAHPRLLEQRLNQAITEAQRRDEGLAVAVFDLASFKLVNDAFGRAAGDDALRTLAQRLAEAAGEAHCARLGSNLFAVMIPGLTRATDIAAAWERIAERCFAREFVTQGQRFSLSARCGIATLQRDCGDGCDAKTLLGKAEAALAHARALGQRTRFHDEQSDARVAERFKLHRQLAHGLERDEFTLHYQAKVDARTFEVRGAEALLRWHNEELGSVSPAQFVPVLEDTGLIDKVGDWVLRQAATASRRLRQLDPALRVAVNVSAAQLLRDDFVDSVRAALGPDPAGAGIDLELTESLLMTDVEGAIEKLRQLRAMGLRIALDDFGTGYSSMAYLARLPLDYLKIDRAFVAGLPDNGDSRTLIASMIGLGHALGLEIIAEGVETAPQAELLAALGCDQLQGYYLARPEARAALENRIDARIAPPIASAA